MSPLRKGTSNKVKSENIRTEVAAGMPRKQAIAVALDMARRSMNGTPKSMPTKKGK